MFTSAKISFLCKYNCVFLYPGLKLCCLLKKTKKMKKKKKKKKKSKRKLPSFLKSLFLVNLPFWTTFWPEATLRIPRLPPTEFVYRCSCHINGYSSPPQGDEPSDTLREVSPTATDLFRSCCNGSYSWKDKLLPLMYQVPNRFTTYSNGFVTFV